MLILISIIILGAVTNYCIGLCMKGLENPPITRYEQEQQAKLRTDIDWNVKGVRHTRRSLAQKAEGDRIECEMIRGEMEEWAKQLEEEKRLRCLEAARARYGEIEAARLTAEAEAAAAITAEDEAAAKYDKSAAAKYKALASAKMVKLTKAQYSSTTPVCFKNGKRVNTSPAPQKNKDTRKKASQIKTISSIIKPGRDGSWIYLMSDGKRLKIGISNNPKRRLKEIRNLTRKNVQILAICTPSNKRTMHTEQVIHYILKDIRTPYKYKDGVISKEWVKNDLNRVLAVLKENCLNVKLMNEATAA